MANTFSYTSHVYFDELDALGVLHHTRYFLHLERAQQAFFQHLLGVEDFNADRDEDIYVVVHGLTSRFRVPVRSPGPMVVEYAIDRIRAGAVIMNYRICNLGRNTVYCDGQRTVSKLSGHTHRPAEWSDAFRAAMEAFLAE